MTTRSLCFLKFLTGCGAVVAGEDGKALANTFHKKDTKQQSTLVGMLFVVDIYFGDCSVLIAVWCLFCAVYLV